ncbi:hypothetical protein GCM10009798_07870 [Nocardioides panacihumi]|uniref:Uncharacterized protein n=1 Tax=Nocardioides panacihumi TaxID=400774 RepID=A0ABN2QF42_9ACTN
MSLRRLLICTACLASLLAFSADLDRADASAPDRSGRCLSAVHDRQLRVRIYPARGWHVRCVSSIHVSGLSNVIGLTLSRSHLILVDAHRGDPLTTLAHELAHAFSLDRMSPGLRSRFTRRMGSRSFSTGTSWATTPAEIWAFNQARCAGYTTAARTRAVSCRVIRTFVRATS